MKSFLRSVANACLIFFALLFTALSGKAQPVRSTKKTLPPKSHAALVRTRHTASGVASCQVIDKNGNLWISVSGEGVYCYDGRRFRNFTSENGLCSNNAGPIIQRRNGNILIGTSSGICEYDGRTFRPYPWTDTMSITSLFEDRNGDLWFGVMGSGVYCYNEKGLRHFLGSTSRLPAPGSSPQLILDIIQDQQGNLWFSSWNGGGVWKYDGHKFEQFLPPAAYYESNQDKRSFPQSDGKALFARPYSHSPKHLPDDMIFSMAGDAAGNIWFATRDHGICRYDGKTFSVIHRNEGFTSRGAYAIIQDSKGWMWITTEEGVWCYDGRSFRNFTEKDGLVNNAVISAIEDRNGNLWFGTKYFGLSRYDGKRFVTCSHPSR
jgi:ligand-binding sensor domain-containing protein